MPVNVQTPTVSHSSKSQPELDKAGKNLLLWLYGRAREAEKFSGQKQTYGAADPQGLEQNDWSGRLRSLIEMEYGQEVASEIFSSAVDANLDEAGDAELDIDALNAGAPDGEKWRVEDPAFTAMSLQKPGDERVPLLTAMSLARGTPQQKSLHTHLRKNLHLVALPTREQVATMLRSNAPGSKVHRLAMHCHSHDLTEEGRQNRNPTPAEEAEADKLIDRAFGKR